MPKHLLIEWVEKVLGLPSMGGVSEVFAKIGLRGLGVNVHYQLDRSGELYLLHHLRSHLSLWTCFDVGANVGDYAHALISSGAHRVVAFEPGADAFLELRKRFGSHSQVQLVKTAIGEFSGSTAFFVPLEISRSSLSSRDKRFTALSSESFYEIAVPLTSIDGYVLEFGVRPDFVKIDVEGFEFEVLIGMRDLLATRPPKVIQFEFNFHHLGRRQTISDFELILRGYRLYRLAQGSLRALDTSHYLGNIYGYSNIVAIHSESGI